MKEPLWRVRQMAARLAVSIPEAYRMLRSGKIPMVRIGERTIRVREQDVERYIRDQRKAG